MMAVNQVQKHVEGGVPPGASVKVPIPLEGGLSSYHTEEPLREYRKLLPVNRATPPFCKPRPSKHDRTATYPYEAAAAVATFS
ncbi:hypothetical protein A4R29_04975 [Mesorhizobium ciceri biovar biserrulae]|nr:hypothetical protein A4R29_04975 [Mesorhizobium ciceri biovar biserrulae]